jgi:hypothetical protein
MSISEVIRRASTPKPSDATENARSHRPDTFIGVSKTATDLDGQERWLATARIASEYPFAPKPAIVPIAMGATTLVWRQVSRRCGFER